MIWKPKKLKKIFIKKKKFFYNRKNFKKESFFFTGKGNNDVLKEIKHIVTFNQKQEYIYFCTG